MKKTIAALGVLAAAVTGAQANTDPLAPVAPLMGCWRGSFENNTRIHDEHCYAPMLDGRYVRDVHRVVPTPYGGEAVYYDVPGEAVGFTYYASDGGISTGTVVQTGAATYAHPAYDHVYSDGRVMRLRSTVTFETPDRYVMATEQEQNGEWRPLMRITYERIPAPQ